MRRVHPLGARAAQAFAAVVVCMALCGCGVHPDPGAAQAPLKIGDAAADFSLTDAHAVAGDPPVQLRALVSHGPVLLVFYLGYECPRCVENLLEIDSRLDEFDAAGLQVIAISPDTVAQTRESAKEFGDFHFPLLCDPDNAVAQRYRLCDSGGLPLHGVFIIDRTDHIRFAASGEHPFLALDSLLKIGHELEGQ